MDVTVEQLNDMQRKIKQPHADSSRQKQNSNKRTKSCIICRLIHGILHSVGMELGRCYVYLMQEELENFPIC